MKVALSAGAAALAANLLILTASVPFEIGFRPVIIAQIAFWTVFAVIGATVTMLLLQKYTKHPAQTFVLFALIVFLLSLIPISLHVGILHDFRAALEGVAMRALIAMHIADSFIISSFLLFERKRSSSVYHK